MTPAQTLLQTVVKASEGTRKDGFTVGSVAFTVNQTNDTITFTGTIPIQITTDATTGALIATAQDFLEPAA